MPGASPASGGFGPTKIHQIRTALDARPPAARVPLWEATQLANALIEGIRSTPGVERIDAAGSLRRARETVGDLDLLVIAADAEAVFDAVPKLPKVASVVLRGGTKETVLLESGVQVDVRVLAPASFGAALQYFTGSKDHNVRLRSLARDQGLKINEYGVYRGEEVIAGTTEADVYGALGLAWIPPELRENRGEIDQAAAGTLPKLLEGPELLGDLHVHLPAGRGPDGLADLVRSARSAGHAYVGVVLDPGDADSARGSTNPTSGSSGPDPPKVRFGVEIRGGALDDPLPPGVDFRLLRADRDPPPAGTSIGAGVLAVTHLALAPPSSVDGDPALAAPWVRWAVEAGVALEMTPAGARDGLDSAAARTFVSKGGRVLISGGAEGTVDPPRLGVAVALARRAGLERGAVRNAGPDPTAGPTALPTTPARRTRTTPRPETRTGDPRRS